DEGVGIQSEVLDETKNLSESNDDSDKQGSTDEEVFHVIPRDKNPKSPPSDTIDQIESEDDQNESDDDDYERVETDDDRDDKEEKDDRSTYIEETDSDKEHQGKGDADMNIEKEVEKEMSKEKPEGDAQPIKAQPNDEKKKSLNSFNQLLVNHGI
ncbi:hypothetical protein Tco_0229114, partial [Tanacetum coccineum]